MNQTGPKEMAPRISLSERKYKFKQFARQDQAEKCATTGAQLNAVRIKALMDNVDRPVYIPELRGPAAPAPPPEFVRNVVGSSAGAGSAEYHIYRNNRKKESARIRYMDKMATAEEEEKEFNEVRDERQAVMEEKTEKNRNKRNKRKANVKANREAAKKQKQEARKADEGEEEEKESSSDDDDGDNDNAVE